MADREPARRAGADEPLRERILATAARMLRREGYRSTTMQRIADELGITKGAITYHFKNKYLIVDALFQLFFDRLRAHIDAYPEAYRDRFWRYAVMYIYAYRAILGAPLIADLFFDREQFELWNVTKERTVCDIYRDIARDFHKELDDAAIRVAKSLDWGGRTGLYRDYRRSDGELSVDGFCYHCVYHMGLLARLDEATIERDIRAAFAFADAHEPPPIPYLADDAEGGEAACAPR